MTTKKARDFLDKELFVKRGVVTFRSLSRALGIHVDDAKNELQAYYDAARETDTPAVPTYLVSGEAPAMMIRSRSTRSSEFAMDVDGDDDDDAAEEEGVEEDVVRQSRVLLVDARALDGAKSELSRVHSVHLYSLSAARLGDAGLVCTQTYKIRETDARMGSEFWAVVGRIAGSVKLKDGAVAQGAASSSKSTLDAPARGPKLPTKVDPPTAKDKSSVNTKTAAPVVAPLPKTESEDKPKLFGKQDKSSANTIAPVVAPLPKTTSKDKPKLFGKQDKSSTNTIAPVVAPLPKTESKDKPKLSGKLDWSKAKTKDKEQVPAKEKKVKVEPDSPVASDVVSGEAAKRGTKRKPPVIADSESESESESVEAKSIVVAGSSVKKGVVYSDDEDEDDDLRLPGKRRSNRKSTITSDSEMSLRAMMDVDDDQVDRVSRGGKLLTKHEESEDEEGTEPATLPPGTTDDEEYDHVPVVQKKRKPRKVVPVGRNGLKKRRVVKSRTTTDAKGYMQTEDYSSYESVDEDEEEPKHKGKGKGKGKETKKASESTDKDEAKPKVAVKEEGTGKPKGKPPAKSRGGASKRGGLLNFFGPEKGKK